MTPERRVQICRLRPEQIDIAALRGELLQAYDAASERADAAERQLNEMIRQQTEQVATYRADTAKASARIIALEAALSKIKNGYDYMDRQMTWQECSSIAEAALRPPQ